MLKRDKDKNARWIFNAKITVKLSEGKSTVALGQIISVIKILFCYVESFMIASQSAWMHSAIWKYQKNPSWVFMGHWVKNPCNACTPVGVYAWYSQPLIEGKYLIYSIQSYVAQRITKLLISEWIH